MFQFPGFALKTLCIQVKSTWFTALFRPTASLLEDEPQVTHSRINNTVSGGLPHSEIHGSKHILSSPWLIAEYHVFHRLLLPRHSPNALFALDLIQKKTGLLRVLSTPSEDGQVLNQKSYFFPPIPLVRKDGQWLDRAIEPG